MAGSFALWVGYAIIVHNKKTSLGSRALFPDQVGAGGVTLTWQHERATRAKVAFFNLCGLAKSKLSTSGCPTSNASTRPLGGK